MKLFKPTWLLVHRESSLIDQIFGEDEWDFISHWPGLANQWPAIFWCRGFSPTQHCWWNEVIVCHLLVKWPVRQVNKFGEKNNNKKQSLLTKKNAKLYLKNTLMIPRSVLWSVQVKVDPLGRRISLLYLVFNQPHRQPNTALWGNMLFCGCLLLMDLRDLLQLMETSILLSTIESRRVSPDSNLHLLAQVNLGYVAGRKPLSTLVKPPLNGFRKKQTNKKKTIWTFWNASYCLENLKSWFLMILNRKSINNNPQMWLN